MPVPTDIYCYGLIILLELTAAFVYIPVYTHMILLVSLILFIGCHNSLRGLSKTNPADQQEKMSTKDVYQFPIIGSCVLFGLYLIFKLLPKHYVMIVVKGYFTLMGCTVLAAQLSKFLRAVLSNLPPSPTGALLVDPIMKLDFFDVFTKKPTPVAAGNPTPITKPDFELALIDIIGIVMALAACAWYLLTNHWASNNLFGILFSIEGIQKVGLGSYYNGFVMLSGLFFYDIFWVFGTEVMVSVAKNFDGPIKLLFPQGPGLPHSLLGLGDIVIPGFFLALMLQFDEHLPRLIATRDNKNLVRSSAPTHTYFWIVYFFYIVGLTVTVIVMYYFKAAQPALLYLVPACLLSSISVAAWKGHVTLLWNYDQEQLKENPLLENSPPKNEPQVQSETTPTN